MSTTTGPKCLHTPSGREGWSVPQGAPPGSGSRSRGQRRAPNISRNSPRGRCECVCQLSRAYDLTVTTSIVSRARRQVRGRRRRRRCQTFGGATAPNAGALQVAARVEASARQRWGAADRLARAPRERAVSANSFGGARGGSARPGLGFGAPVCRGQFSERRARCSRRTRARTRAYSRFEMQLQNNGQQPPRDSYSPNIRQR